jgi:RimJ/RimL family protein N-acetyltransferase
MKKAASIFLRADMNPQDVVNISFWLENRDVTRYLNETASPEALRRLAETTPAPLLTCRFNQYGKFFLVCGDRDPIGFVKLREQGGASGCCEVVVAIGDERLWGNGYGTDAMRAAQTHAFFERRVKKMIAKIYHGNVRSERMVRCCGFREEERLEKLSRYSITFDEYVAALEREREQKILA